MVDILKDFMNTTRAKVICTTLYLIEVVILLRINLKPVFLYFIVMDDYSCSYNMQVFMKAFTMF